MEWFTTDLVCVVFLVCACLALTCLGLYWAGWKKYRNKFKEKKVKNKLHGNTRLGEWISKHFSQYFHTPDTFFLQVSGLTIQPSVGDQRQQRECFEPVRARKKRAQETVLCCRKVRGIVIFGGRVLGVRPPPLSCPPTHTHTHMYSR